MVVLNTSRRLPNGSGPSGVVRSTARRIRRVLSRITRSPSSASRLSAPGVSRPSNAIRGNRVASKKSGLWRWWSRSSDLGVDRADLGCEGDVASARGLRVIGDIGPPVAEGPPDSIEANQADGKIEERVARVRGVHGGQRNLGHEGDARGQAGDNSGEVEWAHGSDDNEVAVPSGGVPARLLSANGEPDAGASGEAISFDAMEFRTRFVAAALFGIAGLAVLLAGEAYLSARDHRATAEQVLADYANLGAEGVATRLGVALAGRLYPPLGAIADRGLGTRPLVAAEVTGPARQMVESSSWAIRIAPTGQSVDLWRDSARAPGLIDVIKAASARLPESAYFGVTVRDNELVVFTPFRSAGRGGAAFGIPIGRVAIAVDSFLARDPLLPASLTRGAAVDSGVAVRLVSGATMIGGRGRPDSAGFQARHALGGLYGDLTVELTVARALAPRLIIGGLPGSRLPLLLGVLGLALVLAVAGVAQLRQERRLARLREDFVAGASHELRTPLAQIRLFAETLRLGRIRSPEEGERSLAVIEREARRLEHLVENLLHFSRAERALLRVTPERIDLATLTHEIVGDFESLAAKGGVRLSAEAAPDLLCDVDVSAYRQILINLLDNAVKYGGRGSTVLVGLARDSDAVTLAVVDQGDGVPADEREQVWHRFWRGAAARRSGIAGTGIGLATVRDLVMLHGGSCWVEPAEPRGARFIVRLPP